MTFETATNFDWDEYVRRFREHQDKRGPDWRDWPAWAQSCWPRSLGPNPAEPDCKAPEDILRDYGFGEEGG